MKAAASSSVLNGSRRTLQMQEVCRRSEGPTKLCSRSSTACGFLLPEMCAAALLSDLDLGDIAPVPLNDFDGAGLMPPCMGLHAGLPMLSQQPGLQEALVALMCSLQGR